MNFRITIEPTSAEARGNMSGTQVFECDSLICLAGSSKPNGPDQSAMCMRAAILGNNRQAAHMYLSFMDDMPENFRASVSRTMMDEKMGKISRELIGKPRDAAQGQQISELDRILNELFGGKL